MKNLICLLVSLCFLSISAQDTDKHYVKTTTYDLSTINNESAGIVSYNNFNMTAGPEVMYDCSQGSGSTPTSGSVNVSIVNNVLSVNFNSSPGCPLLLGRILDLNTSAPLPNLDLGPLMTSFGPSAYYFAAIYDGDLYFYSTYRVRKVDGTLTANFTGTPAYSGVVSIPSHTLFNCYPVCTSCGGGTSTIEVNGNTVTLNLIASWAPHCNIRSGGIDIITLPVSVPNMELGIIQTYGYNSIYRARIVSNKLQFYTTNLSSPPALPNEVSISTSPNPWTVCLNDSANPLLSTESVTYFDDGGKPTLSMSYDKVNKRIWASETTYDNFNRVSKQSYPAPLAACGNYAFKNLLSTSTSDLYKYYSDLNTDEPYQATATHPYAEYNYDTHNPGNIINTTGGNMVNGQWNTGFTYTMPAAQELYFQFGKDYFNGPVVNNREEVITKFYKTVAVDEHGVENVIFSDGEGKTLATARSGGGTTVAVTSLIGTQGYVDVHIPTGITNAQITLIGGNIYYTIYDLKTGLGVDPSTLTGGNIYRVSAFVTSLVEPKTYISSGGSTTYDTTNTSIRGIRYRVNYYDYSLNIYNNAGQLVRSIQPKGTQVNTVVTAVPAYMTSSNFVSTYTYNTAGQVTQSVTPDEGTLNLAYRKDGSPRYSQNSQQSSEGKISYIEYDTNGRAIQSGVIQSSLSFSSLDPNGLLVNGNRTEQTFVIYDYTENIPVGQIAPLPLASLITALGYTQNNLEGSIALTYSSDNGTTISAATWYSYDIYGRTEWIAKWAPDLGVRTINYKYDAKGNTTQVMFNNISFGDRFAHYYTYNSGDQLTKVEFGTPPYMAVQAEYSYYLSGELKRKKIANGAQGIDYVYTLDGKLKSINDPTLASDPGVDTNDLFGMTVDYHDNDYSRAGTNITSIPPVSNLNSNQFNGNIRAIRFANRSLDMVSGTTQPKAYLYNYNRNGWLTAANYVTVNPDHSVVTNSKYRERSITYDTNGNILGLRRTNETGYEYDNLAYTYEAGKNRLNYVNDIAVANAAITYDIEPQSINNYGYNFIGQLTSDNSEGLTYSYNARGLVTEVRKAGNPVVKFFYNETGERIKKEMYNTASPFLLQETDYYMLDAAGNTMSVYGKIGPSGSISFKENPIYGLDRIGVRYGYYNGLQSPSTRYEIADHLGNVRATFTASGTTASLHSYADYYPYGEKLPGRNLFSSYRYAFQGQELDQQTGMEAFELRQWEGRLGRWLCPDPERQFHSSYMGMGNNPVNGRDFNGGTWYKTYIDTEDVYVEVNDGVDITFRVDEYDFAQAKIYATKIKYRQNEMILSREELSEVFHYNKLYNEFFSDVKWRQDATKLGFFDLFKHPRLREGQMIALTPGGGAAQWFIPVGKVKYIKPGYKIVSKILRSGSLFRSGKANKFTEFGYQLSKHAELNSPSRTNPTFWRSFLTEGAKLNPQTWNEAGLNAFKHIIKSGKVKDTGKFFEIRLPSGSGIRLQHDLKFKGFID